MKKKKRKLDVSKNTANMIFKFENIAKPLIIEWNI